MSKSRLQRSRVPLYDFDSMVAVVEPNGDAYGQPRRSSIALRLPGPPTVRLSPDEAHALGSSLVAHAEECGYDPDTGETTLSDD